MRNADAGIVDVDPDDVILAPAADQHPTRGRVFNGVRHEVLQQPAQQAAVGSHHKRAGYEREIEPLCRGEGGKFELDLAHQLVDTEACEFRTERAGVEARHVEERTEDFLNGLERCVDIIDQPAVFAAAALNEARDVEACCVERLQDVVAGCRQKLGLGNIGSVGFPLLRAPVRH